MKKFIKWLFTSILILIMVSCAALDIPPRELPAETPSSTEVTATEEAPTTAPEEAIVEEKPSSETESAKEEPKKEEPKETPEAEKKTELTPKNLLEDLEADKTYEIYPVEGFEGEESLKPSEPVLLNFDNADIEDVIRTVSEIIGMNFILSPGAKRGKVTIYTYRKIPVSQVFSVLESLLEINDLTLVKSGTHYKIVPKASAKEMPIETKMGKQSSAIPAEDRIITQIIPLEYISPDEALALLKPLMSAASTAITHKGTNILILTGLASNIKRLMRIIEVLDVNVSQKELRIIPIKYAEATEIGGILDKLLQAGTVTIPGSGRPPRTTRQTPQQQEAGGPSISSVDTTKETIIIPDQRSNALIIYATKKDLEIIEEVVGMLDMDIYVSEKPYVYYVENVKAGDLATILQTLYGKKGGTTPKQTTPGKTPAGKTPTRPTQGSSLPSSGSHFEGEITIVADETTNALIVVTSPFNWPFIKDTIKLLDIPPKQVLIEVLIAELSLSDSLSYGLEWALQGQDQIRIGDETHYFESYSSLNHAELGLDKNMLGYSFLLYEANRLTAALNLLASQSKLNVLSSPHILASNNQKASIDVGRDVPVVTTQTSVEGSETSTSVQGRVDKTIEYRSTGVLLAVTPHINEKRMVSLEISQEVSDIDEQKVEGISSPVIRKTKVETSVVVHDGQTLVIGGLISDNKTASSSGVPILYKIPLLGKLFGYNSSATRKSELIILITPRVISSPEEAALRTAEFEQKVSKLKLRIGELKTQIGSEALPNEEPFVEETTDENYPPEKGLQPEEKFEEKGVSSQGEGEESHEMNLPDDFQFNEPESNVNEEQVGEEP